jgi:hypothetical protein
MKKLIYLFAFLALGASFCQAQNRVFPFQQNYLWGIVDEKGEVLLEPTFTRMNFFLHHDREDAVAVVSQQGYFGLISRTGEEIIPLRYNGLKFLKGEKALTLKAGRKYGLYNLVDQEGLLNPYYNEFKALDDAGTLILGRKQDSTALYRYDGKVLIELATRQQIRILNPEAACPVVKATLGEEVRYVDCMGKKVKEKDLPALTSADSQEPKDASEQSAPPMLSATPADSESMAKNAVKDRIWEVLGIEAKIVEVHEFAPEQFYAIVVKGRKYGLCDGEADMILPFAYRRVNRSVFGYQFHQNGMFGLYDPSLQKIVLPAKFTHITDPYKTYGQIKASQAYYFVTTLDKRGGYADRKSGKLFFPKE